VSRYWAAYDAAALAKLDGSEVRHPGGELRAWRRDEMRRFFARGSFAAIGSTDYHGLGAVGLSRTYVFATDERAASILDAIRARRTIVYDEDGRAFGDPKLIRLAAEHGHVRDRERDGRDSGRVDVFSRMAGLLGAAGLVLLGFRER
jgi:PHP domain-containing protein